MHPGNNPNSIQLILGRLKQVKHCADGYVASCPVPSHGKGRGDHNPSLSISQANDGRILVRCHAGCPIKEILATINLTARDLRPSDGAARGNTRRPKARQARSTFPSIEAAIAALLRSADMNGGRVTRYEYHGEDGAVAFLMLRFDFNDEREKTFRPIHPTGDRWAIGDPSGMLPLYGLPVLLVNTGRVYVLEGEKCADLARQIGLPATTSAHGANSAEKTDWGSLAGRDVVIVPDKGKDGAGYAQAVARILTTLGATTRIVDLPGLVNDGDDLEQFMAAQSECVDVAGLIDELADKAAVFRARSKAASPDRDAPELEWEPLPMHALPEPVRSYVSESANAIGCDASFVALPLLSVLAAAIGTTRRIELKRRWHEYCILWTLIVGRSGTQRSPAFDQAMRFVHRRQRDAMHAFQKAKELYELDVARHKGDHSEWRKEGRKNREPEPRPPREPTLEQVYLEDVTVEAVAPILLDHERGMLLARDELSGLFRSFNQYKRGNGADEAHWLNMFGGRPLKVNRKTGDLTTIYVPVAAVSITGGIQPGVLRRVLRPEYFESGMAARFLLAIPPVLPRRWRDEDLDPAVEDAMAEVYGKLAALEQVDRDGERVPHDLALRHEAKAMFIRFVNEHGSEQFELDDNLASAWSKLECYAPRLALLIHMVRWAGGDPTLANENAVDAESFSAAITLTRWCARETRRVYVMLAQSEQEQKEERIVNVIRRKGGRITPRELVQRVWSVKSILEAESCLAGLEESGLGGWHYPKPGPKGGQPTKVFGLHAGAQAKGTPAGAPENGGSVDVDAIENPHTQAARPVNGGGET